MATSAAEICNKALARIGVKIYIDDLVSDQTQEAETCNIFYEDARDSLLAEFPWAFAKRRAVLALTAETRSGWVYAFAMPSDCIRPLYIYPSSLESVEVAASNPDVLSGVWVNPRTPRADQRIPYDIEASASADSQLILCDYQTPELVYVSRITDVTKFPFLFSDALSWLLASELALPLTAKQGLEAQMRQRFYQILEQARAQSLESVQEDVAPDSEFISVRS